MRWVRRAAVLGLALGLLSLGGCFFIRAPVSVGPALVIGPLVGAVGEVVEIPVEVVGFPEPGVAGLAVFDLRYDPAAFELMAVTGANGFVVLCSCANNATGQAKFILVNPVAGMTTGTMAALRGVRRAPGEPNFVLLPTEVQLVGAANQVIPTGYALRVGGAPRYGVQPGR